MTPGQQPTRHPSVVSGPPASASLRPRHLPPRPLTLTLASSTGDVGHVVVPFEAGPETPAGHRDGGDDPGQEEVVADADLPSDERAQDGRGRQQEGDDALMLSGAVIVSTCHPTRVRTARRRWSGNQARVISDGRSGVGQERDTHGSAGGGLGHVSRHDHTFVCPRAIAAARDRRSVGVSHGAPVHTQRPGRRRRDTGAVPKARVTRRIRGPGRSPFRAATSGR